MKWTISFFKKQLHEALRRGSPRRPRLRPLMIEALESRDVPTVYTVMNTLDSGTGSFRQAILNSNADTTGTNVIQFDIGSGAQTISLQSQLPEITQAVTIEGNTQPGFNNVPLIALNGGSAGSSANGLMITAGNSTVEDLDIYSFSGYGIELLTNGGDSISGNYIGTGPGGNGSLANGYGVYIQSSNNTIGGTATGAGNLISGNTAAGVRIDGTGLNVQPSENIVEGNKIGTNVAGTAAVGNNNGVIIYLAENNTIGAGNTISGNRINGVEISSGSGNVVEGDNFIGTGIGGNGALPNAANGVYIDAQSTGNTIGGTATSDGNLISGNSGTNSSGVDIAGSGNFVEGNYIGTNVAGSTALGNDFGVFIASSDNTISGNTISGNAAAGVRIDGTGLSVQPTGNVVEDNNIGTDHTGTLPLGNNNGVAINLANNNTIGGTATGTRNIISGNRINGVDMSSATGNVVEGNYIGIDVNGTSTTLGNASDGVYIDAASTSNTIGDTVTGAQNVISENPSSGVYIAGNSNVVEGNFIGTDAAGTGALGNAFGVYIVSSGNIIGGTVAGAANVISGNAEAGVTINGTGLSEEPTGNMVEGNDIGTDRTGTQPVSNNNGVFIYLANTNTIGAGNLISGNRDNGVEIASTTTAPQDATGNVVESNAIGTDVTGTVPLPNAVDGVYIDSANGNMVGGTQLAQGNIIHYNQYDGVEVDGGVSNSIRLNSIYDSGHLGIDLVDSGNDNLAPPVLTLVDTNGSITISGTFTGAPNTTYTVDFFLSPTKNASGFGEGLDRISPNPDIQVTTNANGVGGFALSFTTPPPAGWFFSVTLTGPAGNSSGFAQDVQIPS